MAEPTFPPSKNEKQLHYRERLFLPASLVSEGTDNARLRPRPLKPDCTSTLRFGVPSIDEAIGGLEPPSLTVLHGSRHALTLSHLLAVRAQLPLHEHGLDSPVLLIDAGCSFDPHRVSSLAQSHQMNPIHVLERIRLSRAFTVHQLSSLIYGWLPRAMEDHGARLVVISDLLGLFADLDTPREELLTSFLDLAKSLSNLAQKEDAAILVTVPQRYTSPKMGALLRLLNSRANMILRLEERRGYLRLTLERHPKIGPGFIDVPLKSLEQGATIQGLLAVNEAG